MAVMTLVELAALVCEADVDLGRGRSVRVRALEGWEENLLHRALPRPEAPRIPDPNMGSASTATVPDTDDPAYADAMEAWFYGYRVAYAAAATGVEGWDAARGTPLRPGEVAGVRTWCDSARERLARLGVVVVDTIYRRAVELGQFAGEAALGASAKN